MDKRKWELAKKNGLERQYRADEIAKGVGVEYSINDQIALLFDKDTKPDEVATYQQKRAKVKEEIDAKIGEFNDSGRT